MTDPLPPGLAPDPAQGNPAATPWAKPLTLELTPWPAGWVQTRDPARDGDPGSGPNALNNCGPESIAEVVMHLTDIELDADYIFDSMHIPAGYTSLADLQTFLSRYCHTRAQILFPHSQPEWLALIRAALRLAHPLVGLFSFSAPGAPDGHFRPIIGLTAADLITSDPWKGQRRTEPHATAWAWAKGPLIHVQRSRAIGP